MKAIDLIRHGLQLSGPMTLALLDDMRDAPLQPPTSNGGNHPLWILGHLTYSEANIVEHIIQGRENPLLSWKPMFGAATQPSTNPDDYLPWDDVRAEFNQVRQRTMAFIDTLTDDDLDQPSKNPPHGREAVFGTVSACCMVLCFHPLMHRGQVADARRMLSRVPLVG